jgi:hypothetical protein
MELADLALSPYPEIFLAVGGIIALTIAIVGRSDKTYVDEVAIGLSLVVGVFMMVMAFLVWDEGGWDNSTFIVLGVLGYGLFMRLFKEVKWAALVAIGVAIVVFLLLTGVAEGDSAAADLLSETVIVVISLVAMFIVYLMLKFFEDISDMFGALVSFRPVLFVLGLMALVEVALILMDSSLSQLF